MNNKQRKSMSQVSSTTTDAICCNASSSSSTDSSSKCDSPARKHRKVHEREPGKCKKQPVISAFFQPSSSLKLSSKMPIQFEASVPQVRQNPTENNNFSQKFKRPVCISTFEKLQNYSHVTRDRLETNNEHEIENDNNVKTDILEQTVIMKKDANVLIDNRNDTDSKDLNLCLRESESFNQIKKFSEKEYKFQEPQPSCRKKIKYTPLEEQYMAIKQQNPDAILLVECGYKYRFFDEDAKIASQILSIGCYQDHNFLSASIPTHRLHVHIRRLVTKGYKVGVVKQIETAALKAAGNNKNSVFSRKLTALYTKSTMIGEDVCPSSSIINGEEDEQVLDFVGDSVSGFLAAVYETAEKKGSLMIGVVAVQPTTGDVLYSSFHDSETRSELESCLIHIHPIEVILPETLLSPQTVNLVKEITTLSPTADDRSRIEWVSDNTFDFTTALSIVSTFYQKCSSDDSHASSEIERSQNLQKVMDFPPVIICCLSSLIKYLEMFHLESVLYNPSNFSPLSTTSQYINLPATTIRNLEIFQNKSDFKEYGSLFWVLNHTRTKFGSRMLKHWLRQPLRDFRQIEERQEVVSEVLHSDCMFFSKLAQLLSKLPDLEKGLCAALHKKCNPSQFLAVVRALNVVQENLKPLRCTVEIEVQAPTLKALVLETVELLGDIQFYLNSLDEKAASKLDTTSKLTIVNNIFTSFPDVVERKKEMNEISDKLNSLRPTIAQLLNLSAFNFVTVAGQEYLIEVKNTNLSHVPRDWLKISMTKQVSRFRSPAVESLLNQLQQVQEKLKLACHQAWLCFLDEFNSNFYRFKKVVSNLATLDCFFSLAEFAKQENYCRPALVDTFHKELKIVNGRHPIIEKLLSGQGQYVPNDTFLNSEKRCMIITGPNMGGKSSYIKQVALITILAHIGSYVPAESVTISPVDGIFTSWWNIYKIKCLTLFVTHYLLLTELQDHYPRNVTNHQMVYMIGDEDNTNIHSKDVSKVSHSCLTFLYKLGDGAAERSFGLNVARMAGIPESIINLAYYKSQQVEQEVKKRSTLRREFLTLWNKIT
ncbi:DNA mismatch repair protein Msh3-like [Limulus polyphemus]|uniref:DNA mismatch repair protein Msh3-like n=1 Tax=Limulus polyphemus TaxID=6850 RepID=A0ABM1TDZ2_LIMPO|nr:DNA mismatch repair protein Msh3-like [Limulus polyphemus]